MFCTLYFILSSAECQHFHYVIMSKIQIYCEKNYIEILKIVNSLRCTMSVRNPTKCVRKEKKTRLYPSYVQISEEGLPSLLGTCSITSDPSNATWTVHNTSQISPGMEFTWKFLIVFLVNHSFIPANSNKQTSLI